MTFIANTHRRAVPTPPGEECIVWTVWGAGKEAEDSKCAGRRGWCLGGRLEEGVRRGRRESVVVARLSNLKCVGDVGTADINMPQDVASSMRVPHLIV